MIVPEDAAATMNRMLRRASPANLPGADPTPVAMRETTWHTAKTGMFTDDYRCVRRPFQGAQRGVDRAPRRPHLDSLPSLTCNRSTAIVGRRRVGPRVIGRGRLQCNDR